MSLVSIRKDILFNGLNMNYNLNETDIKNIDDLLKDEKKFIKQEEEQEKKRVDKLKELKEKEDEYNLNISTYTKDKYTKEMYKEYRKNYEERKEFLEKEYNWASIDLKELNNDIKNFVY